MRGIRKFNSSVMDECHNVIDESFLELEKLCSESSNIMVNCIISSVTLYISVVSSSNDVNRSICGVSSICLAAFNATFMFLSSLFPLYKYRRYRKHGALQKQTSIRMSRKPSPWLTVLLEWEKTKTKLRLNIVDSSSLQSCTISPPLPRSNILTVNFRKVFKADRRGNNKSLSAH